jgi:F-type H+-transporting ATPase subunit alpha
MKEVAGTLRLEMAQFRELQVFAQLGTDLDPATQRQLNRGMCLVEILKQQQFQPMEVEDQVILLYIAIHGYCDNIPPANIKEFEGGFLDYVHGVYPQVLKDIRETGRLNQKSLLNEIGLEYSQKFLRDHHLLQEKGEMEEEEIPKEKRCLKGNV